MPQIKLPTKLTFVSVVGALAALVTWLLSSGLVPPQYAGVVGAIGTLLGSILQLAPKPEEP